MAKTSTKPIKTKHPQESSSLLNSFDWLALLPLMVSFLAYLAAFSNDFVEWDDNRYVYDNPDLGKWDAAGWKYLLGKYVMGNWHPLTMMSLSLDKTLLGLDPGKFHAVNVALHAINALLVYLLGRRLFSHTGIALTAGLLFAVHPLHVESVAWVSERKDVLYTCGTLLALLHWHSWIKNGNSRSWTLSLLFFALACLSKAQAVIMPVLALLITVWEKPEDWKQIKRHLPLVPFFLVSLIIGFVAIDAQADGGNVRVFREYSWLDQILIGLYGFFLYLAKTVWPFGQSAYYPYPVKENGTLPMIYFLAPVLLGGMVFLVWRFARAHKPVWLGTLFFLIAILPVLQFLPVGETMISERYYYLPSAGLFFLIAWMLWRIPVSDHIRNGIVGLLVGCLGLLCYNRTRIWNNTYSLFLDVMHQHENVPVAYNNIANQFTKDKKYELAIPLYLKALSIRPEYAIGWHNLGNNYTHLNRYPKALQSFERYLEIRPNDEVVYKKIGTVYSKMGSEAAAAGKIEDAASFLEKAIQHDPDLVECYVNLGNIAAMRQDYATAENRYNSALLLNPENSGTWFNLGMMRLQSGNSTQGVEAVRKAAGLGHEQARQWLNQYAPQN